MLEFTALHGDVSVGDVQAALALPRSTAHRLLQSLREGGYLEPLDLRGRYRLGLKLYALGQRADVVASLCAAAQPVMADLAATTGESVNLAQRVGGRVVYVDHIQSHQALRTLVKIGDPVPLHCSSVGKVVLAFLSAAEREEILGRIELTAFTHRSIVTPDALRKELERARETGFAVNDEEHALGIRSLAAPILDDLGYPLGALSIAGPAVRIGCDEFFRLGELVARAAGEVARAAGLHSRQT